MIAALRAVAHVADVSKRGSRYSDTDVRVYAHVEPVADGEIVDAVVVGEPAAEVASARRPVSRGRRRALG